MSGTSCDGVDVAIVDFNATNVTGPHVIASATEPYPDAVKNQLLDLIANKPCSISVISQLDAQLGMIYAEAIKHLFKTHLIDKNEVIAIGLHGQTIYHQPPNKLKNLFANTIQLGSAAITAQQTGITTVANFRQMDVAHGGQGAPLAPVLHQQLFNQLNQSVIVLNLGGIANITVLNEDTVIGFDTGPASCLMDEYIQVHRDLPFDDSGHWAQSGQVDKKLLQDLMAEVYFGLPYPKSTGRELFNLTWLNQILNKHKTKAADVQRTLLQLTVDSVALAVKQVQCNEINQMVVCGGGVHNKFLMQQLQKRFDFKVLSSAELGLDPDCIEAVLMAWFAKLNMNKQSLNMAAITGCKSPHVYGIQFLP